MRASGSSFSSLIMSSSVTPALRMGHSRSPLSWPHCLHRRQRTLRTTWPTGWMFRFLMSLANDSTGAPLRKGKRSCCCSSVSSPPAFLPARRSSAVRGICSSRRLLAAAAASSADGSASASAADDDDEDDATASPARDTVALALLLLLLLLLLPLPPAEEEAAKPCSAPPAAAADHAAINFDTSSSSPPSPPPPPDDDADAWPPDFCCGCWFRPGGAEYMKLRGCAARKNGGDGQGKPVKDEIVQRANWSSQQTWWTCHRTTTVGTHQRCFQWPGGRCPGT